eukprot:scaffold849_cov386-Pavlova_lutheri.AAC.1
MRGISQSDRSINVAARARDGARMIGAIGATDGPIGACDGSNSSLGGTAQFPCVRGGQIGFRSRSLGLLPTVLEGFETLERTVVRRRHGQGRGGANGFVSLSTTSRSTRLLLLGGGSGERGFRSRFSLFFVRLLHETLASGSWRHGASLRARTRSLGVGIADSHHRRSGEGALAVGDADTSLARYLFPRHFLATRGRSLVERCGAWAPTSFSLGGGGGVGVHSRSFARAFVSPRCSRPLGGTWRNVVEFSFPSAAINITS